LRISSLKIKNFKNIPYLELGDLQNVVVIAGENGAGKSSTLRAIDFVKDVLYHRRREYQCRDGEIIRDQQKRMEI
jgi:AAA15 family ATPase/GTPase